MADTTGPGDARPTALQVICDEGLTGQLVDKSILLTGASAGISVETAKALYTTGATLYLTARNTDKAKQALGADLAHPPPRAPPQAGPTKIATNYLGHFLLFLLLRPALLAGADKQYAEVVLDNINLDGEYERWRACGQSNTAILWAANEIDRRIAPQGLRAFSVQPGGIQTGLLQYMSEDEKNVLASDPVLGPQFKSPEQGAANSVWGAISNLLEGMGGKYLEDVQIAKEYDASEGQWAPGYVPHAYSPEKKEELWKISLKLVGEDA
ncbi:hypothetical protein BDW69DRAFT_199639 [Aspergillus filifer]